MNTLPIENVLHPTDFTRSEASAFAHALKIALLSKSKLHLFHVGQADEEVHWEDFPHVRPWLESWRIIPSGSSHQDVINAGLHLRKVRRKGSDAAAGILEFMERDSPDLVVMATDQRRGVLRWIHHSVSEPVVRKTRAMTLFVPRRVQGFVSIPTGEVHLRNIVVPMAHKPNPQVAVEGLVRLLDALQVAKTHVTFFHAGPESSVPEARIPSRPGWTSEADAWEGDVVDHILRISEDRDADLIVMATKGRDGFLDAIRGTTTERVLRGVRCPLLAVPEASL